MTGGEAARPAAVTPRRHAIGLCLISAVALIWVGSSELIQYIFGEANFEKPFFLTYLSTSLFGVYLFGFALFPSWRGAPRAEDYEPVDDVDADAEDSGDAEFPADGVAAVKQDEIAPYTMGEVFRVGMALAPIFFTSNFTFNVGLRTTTVASSSTIATLSALFSLVLGAFAGVERFSLAKLASAVLTIGGVAIISSRDNKQGGKESLYGDLVSVFAALVYSVYTIQLKRLMPSEKVASMAMMFGFMGACVAVIGLPVLISLHFLGVERFIVPSWHVVGLLMLNALVGTVLSDYLWAMAVTYTTPLIATLALSLSLPLSLIFDYFLRSLRFSWFYLSGVALVLSGFVAANLDEAMSSRRETVVQ